MQGWIKLHRKSLNSAVFSNPNLWKVFTYCLIQANYHSDHKFEFNSEEIILRPGQFICGRIQGAKDCNMKESTFYYQLRKLKSIGIINIEPNNQFSIITIIKWGYYQDSNDNYDSSSDNRLTTDEQQTNTFKKERIKE